MLGRCAIALGVFCGALAAADQNALTTGLEQGSLRQLNEKALEAAMAAGLPGSGKLVASPEMSLGDLFGSRTPKPMILAPPPRPAARACAIPLMRAPVDKPDQFTMKKLPAPKMDSQVAKPPPVPACKE